MRKSDAFKSAVEAEDPDAVAAALADDVVFLSPAVFKPYEGKELVAAILTQGAMKVFEDFTYIDHLEDGDTAMLVFEARVGDRSMNGLDLLRFDSDGKVRELMVMVRPLSGLNALAEAMARRFQGAGIGSA
jgi:SnoaL-like protein